MGACRGRPRGWKPFGLAVAGEGRGLVFASEGRSVCLPAAVGGPLICGRVREYGAWPSGVPMRAGCALGSCTRLSWGALLCVAPESSAEFRVPCRPR